VLPLFEEAAKQLGYTDNDREWFSCISEEVAFCMPYQLRQLFTTLLVYSNVSDVHTLWNKFSDHLAEDFARKYRELESQTKEDMVMFHTLKSLNDLLQVSGASVQDYDLPQLGDYPDLVHDYLLDNNLIRRELESYDHDVLEGVDARTDDLNNEQHAIYDRIMDAVRNPADSNKLFFIAGRHGKIGTLEAHPRKCSSVGENCNRCRIERYRVVATHGRSHHALYVQDSH
jgi:hypothetical protein